MRYRSPAGHEAIEKTGTAEPLALDAKRQSRNQSRKTGKVTAQAQSTQSVRSLGLLTLRSQCLSGEYSEFVQAARNFKHSVAKRLFDAFLAGAGLVLSAPLWALFAALIKLEDGGPVFYGQARVGRHGQKFKSWKFRSMLPGADRRLQAKDNDPRVTRVGRILRATAMDELPQLWNILKGDMSFVGPRALLPEEIEVNGSGDLVALREIPGYEARHSIRPGLTGVAQIYAPRDIPRRHKFRYDVLYIKRRSLGLDLRLIALSFWITFRASWEKRGKKF